MQVYHGSKNKFNTFSYSFIRTNATSEGIGFYFTDNKEIAQSYAQDGFLYTVDFTGKNQLSHEKLTITKAKLKKFLKTLNSEFLQSNNEGIDYLSNYNDVNYYGIENVLREAVDVEYSNSKNDVDLIAGICNVSGNFELTLKTLYKSLGYDSIVLDAEWGNQKIYIATVNDVIKIEGVTEIR